MGNIFKTKKDDKIQELEHLVEILQKENDTLRSGKTPVIRMASIEKYVEELLKKREINIDYLPDSIESRIYKNIISFVVELMDSILENIEVKVFNQTIKVEMLPSSQ